MVSNIGRVSIYFLLYAIYFALHVVICQLFCVVLLSACITGTAERENRRQQCLLHLQEMVLTG